LAVPPDAVLAEIDEVDLEEPGLDPPGHDGHAERPIEEPREHGHDVDPHPAKARRRTRSSRVPEGGEPYEG
jgi:hypothetical protein